MQCCEPQLKKTKMPSLPRSNMLDKKSLVCWSHGDDHSIVVNKGVCNTLDAKVFTMSIDEFETSMLKLRPLTYWTISANPKDNGSRA